MSYDKIDANIISARHIIRINKGMTFGEIKGLFDKVYPQSALIEILTREDVTEEITLTFEEDSARNPFIEVR